jgi:exodeoxyribonuclease-1
MDTRRIALDLDRNLAHLARVRSATGLAEKVRRVFGRDTAREAAPDPELALYDGFLSDADKPLLRTVRQTPPEQLGQHDFGFSDKRYAELLFRYRARNWPHTLDAAEAQRWEEFRRRRLETATALTPRTLTEYFATIAALRTDPATTREQHEVLDRLEQWGRTIL